MPTEVGPGPIVLVAAASPVVHDVVVPSTSSPIPNEYYGEADSNIPLLGESHRSSSTLGQNSAASHPSSSASHGSIQPNESSSPVYSGPLEFIMTPMTNYFLSLSPMGKALFLVVSYGSVALMIVAMVYSGRILTALMPVAGYWRNMRGGWVILWLLIFVFAFPPLFGWNLLLTLSGFLYGFPGGWPIAASATVAGSLAAFLVSRGVLSGYVQRWVGDDKRFVALLQVLQHGGLRTLIVIRICPLPYTPSNGFLATIPTIHPLSFALATATVEFCQTHFTLLQAAH